MFKYIEIKKINNWFKIEKNKILFIFLLVFLLHLPYTQSSHPNLHLDEAYYIHQGQLISQGETIYVDFISDKPPGIAYTFSLLFGIFGESIIAVRLLTALINSFSAITIYYIGKNLFDRRTGFFSSLFFGFALVHPSLSSYYGLTEPYMVFLSNLSILFFIKSLSESNRLGYFISGIFVTMSFLMKQPGCLTIFILYLISYQSSITNIRYEKFLSAILASFGSLLSLLLVCLYLYKIGNFNEALWYSFTQNFYIDEASNCSSLTCKLTVATGIVIWLSLIFSLAFFSIFIFINKKWKVSFIPDLKNSDNYLTLILWLIPLFIFIFLSFDIYDKYYLQLMPPFCLMAGYSLKELGIDIKSLKSINSYGGESFIIFFLIFSCILNSSGYIYSTAVYDRSNEFYEISMYIKENTNETDKIYAPNADIYIYSERSSSSRYFVMMLGVITVNTVQETNEIFIEDFEENKPVYIIPHDLYNYGNIFNSTLTYIYENYHYETTISNFEIYRINDE